MEKTHLVFLSDGGPPLRVTRQCPADVAVGQLGGADLAGEGSIGLVVDVLRADFDLGVKVLSDDEEVESRWGDDDLCTMNQAESR